MAEKLKESSIILDDDGTVSHNEAVATTDMGEEELAFMASFGDEQKKALLRKIDIRLIPFLSFLYLISYLDRANIGNANIEGLSEDLGLSGTQYNICLAIFFVPYILLEIPANMILKKFDRPSTWIAIMTSTWGLVLLCTGFVKSYAGLAVTRVLLGVTEAGFFPGAILIVTSWYSWNEVGVRIALFYTSSALAGAFSGLLAFLIAKMDGIGGYEGWRWIFLLEGGASLLIGLVCPFVLIDTPRHSKWLTDDEKRYLILRKQIEDGGRERAARGDKMSSKVIVSALLDWKIYLQALIALSNTIPNYGLKFTMPQIMKNMGYTSANAQLLTIPPYFLGACSAYVSARFADRYKWRMPSIVGPQLLVIVGFAISFAYAGDIKHRIAECYFAISVACIGLYPIIPSANAWNSNNLAGPAKRAIGIGLLGTFASAGGLGGSFIYIQEESPWYTTGFSVSLGIAVIGLLSALFLDFALWRINKSNEKMTVEEIHAKYTEQELADMGDNSPLFKYRL
ncbi:unnamed protein product [Clonostachys byssicola]|uniref:Major facilitator superfamily (MFS) profile domain-containing protein n=1 Tax=Clonostachys byssicola TaxID=160290 RepID=A0A9N9UXT5_9HYPO|nr:unnamed protein product [Clonostachys byssicola]